MRDGNDTTFAAQARLMFPCTGRNRLWSEACSCHRTVDRAMQRFIDTVMLETFGTLFEIGVFLLRQRQWLWKGPIWLTR